MNLLNFNKVNSISESLLTLHQTEFYQFNNGDTNFMNSNEFFILEPDPGNNCNQPDSTIITSENKSHHTKIDKSATLKTDCKSKNISCDLCNNVFQRTIDLKKHKRSNHNILPKIYKCPKCSDCYNFEHNFKIHLYSHIKTTAIKQCPECLQNFKRTTIFHKHLKIHQNNDCYQCDKCKMEFEFKEYYDWHLNETNTNRNCNIVMKNKTKSFEVDKKPVPKKHICQICGKRFQKPSFLKRHENIHFNIKPFECQECSAKFNQKNSLERHKLVHTKQKPYECPKCNMRFSQRPNLIIHDKNVHSSSPSDTTKFPCPNCSCVFNKVNSLNRHITKKHKLEPINEGNSANNVIEQLKNLLNQQNLQNNTNETDNNSVISFDKQEILQSNLPENNFEIVPVPANNSNDNIMDNNIRSNKIDSKLVKIVDTHTMNPNKEIKYKIVQQIIENGVKWFACSVCEKKFKRSYDLLRHLTVHTKERAFVCGICSRAFSLKNTLKHHLKVHSQEKKFQCTICFLKFRTLTQLSDHISVHGELKLFFCHICGNSFRTNHNLKVHHKIHRPKNKRLQIIEKTLIPPIKLDDNIENDLLKKNEEKFQCLVCGILLKSKSHLRFHENQHLNLKTFECTICNKKFSTKSSLNVHRKIHFTIRSLSCDLCPSKFRHASDLKRHAIVHSTERKFLCPYCNNLFKTKGTCSAHIKLHAKEILLNVEEKSDNNEIFENQLELLQNNHENINNTEEVNLEPDFVYTNQNISLNISSIEENLNSYCELPENDIFFQNDTDENLITFNNNSNIQNQIPNIESYEENSIINTEIIEKSNNLLEKAKFIDLQDLQNTTNQRLKTNFIVESIEKTPQLDNNINTEPNSTIITNIKVNCKTKQYLCDYCPKYFKKPIDCRRHIRIHTKEKPFECNICNKSFTVKCTLKDHLKTHDENRPGYSCIVCNKKYASNSILKTHLRLHTGEMPYHCGICFKKFRTLGHRNSHVC